MERRDNWDLTRFHMEQLDMLPNFMELQADRVQERKKKRRERLLLQMKRRRERVNTFASPKNLEWSFNRVNREEAEL